MINWLRLPQKVYFKRGSTPVALRELSEVYGYKKAFLISTASEFNAGITRPIEQLLKDQGIAYACFSDFDGEFEFNDAFKGLAKMQSMNADVIIGIGGYGAMTMARLMTILCDDPEADFEELAAKYGKITDVVSGCPGDNVPLVLIPANNYAGTFPVAAALNEGKKSAIIDFAGLPFMVVIDPNTAESYSLEEIKKNAEDALALVEKVSADEDTSDYARGLADQAIEVIKANIPLLGDTTLAGKKAVENLANATAIAGIAAANGNIDSI